MKAIHAAVLIAALVLVTVPLMDGGSDAAPQGDYRIEILAEGGNGPGACSLMRMTADFPVVGNFHVTVHDVDTETLVYEGDADRTDPVDPCVFELMLDVRLDSASRCLVVIEDTDSSQLYSDSVHVYNYWTELEYDFRSREFRVKSDYILNRGLSDNVVDYVIEARFNNSETGGWELFQKNNVLMSEVKQRTIGNLCSDEEMRDGWYRLTLFQGEDVISVASAEIFNRTVLCDLDVDVTEAGIFLDIHGDNAPTEYPMPLNRSLIHFEGTTLIFQYYPKAIIDPENPPDWFREDLIDPHDLPTRGIRTYMTNVPGYDLIGWQVVEDKLDVDGNTICEQVVREIGLDENVDMWVTGDFTVKPRFSFQEADILYYGLSKDTVFEDRVDSYKIYNEVYITQPSTEGHEFLGWTAPSMDCMSKSIHIMPGTSGTMVFTAHWDPEIPAEEQVEPTVEQDTVVYVPVTGSLAAVPEDSDPVLPAFSAAAAAAVLLAAVWAVHRRFLP